MKDASGIAHTHIHTHTHTHARTRTIVVIEADVKKVLQRRKSVIALRESETHSYFFDDLLKCKDRKSHQLLTKHIFKHFSLKQNSENVI